MNRYTKIHDFESFRLTGVGSSDVSTLALLNKRWGETPYTLWREKVGLDKREPAGPRAEWGHRLEGVILAKFIEKRYGPDAAAEYMARKMRGQSSGPFKTETECRSPERPYCIAHADLVYDPYSAAEIRQDLIDEYGERYIVEAKSAGLMSARRDDDNPDSGYSRTIFTQDGIPASVFLQTQWQMYVYGVGFAYVAALIDTGDYREYGPFPADPRIQEKLLALAERFWELVETKREPKPETWADVALLFPETEKDTATLGGKEEMRARAMIAEYHGIKKREKEGKERLEEITNALGIYMGKNSALVTPEGVKLASSWSVKTEYAKVAEIREKIPNIYDVLKKTGFITESTRRYLRPAKIKGGE